MSYEEGLRSISLDADASIAVFTGVSGVPGAPATNYGKQYCFLKVTGEHAVGLAAVADAAVVGVLQNKPQVTGQAATVGIRGVSNVMLGGTVAAGDALGVKADGTAIKSGGTGAVVGVALAGGTTGTLVPALLRCN